MPIASPSMTNRRRMSVSEKPSDFMIAMSRAFSCVMVDTMLKMPKPATSMIAATTVYMITLRTTSASRMDSFASCQATAL